MNDKAHGLIIFMANPCVTHVWNNIPQRSDVVDYFVVFFLISGRYDLSKFSYDPNDTVSLDIRGAIFNAVRDLEFTGVTVSPYFKSDYCI